MSVSAAELASADHARVSQFSGGLIDLLDRVEYSRVRMDVTDNPVYRLRYEAYRREQFVPFNDSGTVVDDLDSTSNAYCYGIHIDGELVSSIRVHHLTPSQRLSPSMRVFPDILGPQLDRGQTFIDPSRFTADYDASLAYPVLPFLTLRIAVMATEYFDATACLALVRREHGAFYKRVFGAVPLSDVRPYPGLAFPVMLYSSVADESRSYIYNRFPFFRSTSEERRLLFSQTDARGFEFPLPARSRDAAEQAGVDTRMSRVAAE